MQVCLQCGAEFDPQPVINGRRLDLRGRKRCLDCYPHHPQRRPRKCVVRPIATKMCESCGRLFARRQVIDGDLRYLYRRRFCLDCSPFGAHNTSKDPPGVVKPEHLLEHRRRRRNKKTYRYQKRRRRELRIELIQAAGGKCVDCGYSFCRAALEFHHRDPATKEFTLSMFTGSRARLLAEAAKCDLVCANCHRTRHARIEKRLANEVLARERWERKVRAVEIMGSHCRGCDRDGPMQLFEFHHLDASSKDFGVSEDGILRKWSRVIAELAKCVMLCANCHREVHAGLREIDDGLLGLAEESAPYLAA